MNNVTKNTGTPTNITRGTSDLQWKDANFTWAEGGGTWGNPHDIGNATKNTASPTNQSKS